VKQTIDAGESTISAVEHDRAATPRVTINSMHSDAAVSSKAQQRISQARGGFKLRDLTRAVAGTIKAGLPVRCIEIELDGCKIRLQIKDTELSENRISDGPNDWSDAK
jgi:hypothetical protein